jgi:hypothetical protein
MGRIKGDLRFRQGIYPSFNLRWNKFELGLGLDYDNSYNKWNEQVQKDNYIGLSTFIPCYLGKRERIFIESFAKTGYYWSNGFNTLVPDGFQTCIGVGAGARIHFKALDKYPFWRHVDFSVRIRQNITNLDHPLGSTFVTIGAIRRFVPVNRQSRKSKYPGRSEGRNSSFFHYLVRERYCLVRLCK